MDMLSITPQQEEPRNAIVVFANQKGGVGKTTLCTTFANYMTAKGHPVLVIDCDAQQSIYKKRKDDLKAFPGAQITYNVQAFDITNVQFAQQLMESARRVRGTVIIDSPGSLSQNGIIPILTQCDYIVCPFQFDKVTNVSTADFILFINTTCKKLNITPPQFIFVPNRFNRNWGTKQELEAWLKTEEIMKEYGVVTPRVIAGAEMLRYNTIINTPKQNVMTGPTFKCIEGTMEGHLIA